jgi:photosystem II stability/assembly factor-like uncharacterized protein
MFNKLTLICGLFLSVISFASQHYQWFPLNSNTNSNLLYIDFPTPQVGYINSLSPFLKTTNGGVSWTSSPSPNVGTPVRFLNNDVGFLGFSFASRTLNGSQAWGSIQLFGTIEWVTPTKGYIVNNEMPPKVYRTTNFGSGFVPQISTINDEFFQLTDLYFINEATGYAVGLDTRPELLYGKIYMTTSFATSWVNVYSDQVTAELSPQIQFASSIASRTAYAGGYANGIIKSTDGGFTWTFVPVPGFTPPFTVKHFVNENTGFVKAGDGKILLTLDGGASWSAEFEGSEQINDLYFVSNELGFAIGNNGKLLSTEDLTAIHPVSNQVPKSYSLSQNYPNPFNPSTKIRFDLPKQSFAKLNVYDVIGKKISILINKELNAGTYEIEWNASAYPSGIYFYVLSAGDFKGTRKMILIK